MENQVGLNFFSPMNNGLEKHSANRGNTGGSKQVNLVFIRAVEHA